MRRADVRVIAGPIAFCSGKWKAAASRRPFLPLNVFPFKCRVRERMEDVPLLAKFH